jgi:GNAT superfamily N-acetyltransferase
MINIIKAKIDNLSELVPLFDAYRVFYQQVSDVKGAEAFLNDRIKLSESEIFLAFVGSTAIGFTQLFPTFSSVSMERSYILNDLYVVPDYRGKGVGKQLLNFAQEWTRQKGYKGLALETASDNPARKLYEKEGWTEDEGYLHYFWKRT